MKRIYGFLFLLAIALTGYAQNPSDAKKAFFPVLKDGSPSAYVAFTQPKQTHGLAMVNPEGIEYSTENYLGRRGAKPADSSKEKYFYFQAATDQLVIATGTFFVTVTYLDKGQGALALDYLFIDKEEKKQPRNERVFLGNSGIWQQHTFTLAGAILDHSFPSETDFRIYCPDILIHAVMLTRVPVAKQEHATSSLFRQEGISPPPGYEFGVMLTGTDVGEMWGKDLILEEKTRLYRAWGTPYIIDTINTSMLQTPRGSYDFSLYADHAKKIVERGLVWTPRFKIGEIDALPKTVAAMLQKAVGTDRPKEGPMISLWESRLIDVYSQMFDDMRKSINPQQLPKMVLSFAGDWGPLYFSAGASDQSGWPDFWAGDPLAQRQFADFLQRRYGNINALKLAWNDNSSSWNTIVPSISSDYSPTRILDTYTWYRESLVSLVQQIVSKARLFFPQTSIVLEIAEDFEFSATDATALVAVAAESNSSMVMVTRNSLSTTSPLWLAFANACQKRGVKFGLRCIGKGSGNEMLSALYSLTCEGGTLFYFAENFLVGEDSWAHYAGTVGTLRIVKPNSQIAVVLPRTSMTVESPLAFLRLASELRELFGYDVIDENNLGSITSVDYPFIFVPWGTIWSRDAITHFDRLVRSGAALVVHTEKPWQTLQGEVDFNENLFAVQLVKGADGWRLEPRTQNTQPYEKTNPVSRTEQRVVQMGLSGDDVFLGGQWGDPENEMAAQQYGLSFKSFRWMGERGQINLPMRPGKEYQIEIEGFIPPGKRVQVFVNREYLGGIVGNGEFRWNQKVSGKLQARNGDVNVLLRGQLWSMGEILNATQSRRVSLAVSKISVAPVGEKPDQLGIGAAAPTGRPDFEREALRGSWLREVGQGVTLIAPGEYVNEWIFREMLNTITRQPIILDARYRFTFPPDGERNDVFVKSLNGNSAIYLNLDKNQIQVGGWDRINRARIIPPQSIYYSN